MLFVRNSETCLAVLSPETPMVGGAMSIHLNDHTDIQPTKVTTTCTIPLHFQDDGDILVNKLLREGVIARVDTPTEWCAPAFFVKKPSSGLRLVTDFTSLNRHVKHLIHPFPAPQDIISSLSPKLTVFTKLDALAGYHQVPLTTSTSFMMTFLLPSGMYRYLHALMGLSSSSDKFCRHWDAVFAGLPGVRKLVDDILVEGDNLKDLEAKINLSCYVAGRMASSFPRRSLRSGRKSTLPGTLYPPKGFNPAPDASQRLLIFQRQRTFPH